MTIETCFPVRMIEIDLLGIVHHANYPIWFEMGRSDYFKNADIPMYKLNTLGLFLPLSKMECEFKSPAKFGDEMRVITKLISMTWVKITFEYKVLNKLNGKTLATGKTVHAWTDKNLEPLNLEKAAPEIYRKLKQLIESTETT